MAGVKRAQPSGRANGPASARKRAKPDAPSKPQPKRTASGPRIPLETETDSDPIVESDTNEESGADDGASWPSDDDEDGGVAVPSPKKGSATKTLPARQKDWSSGKSAGTTAKPNGKAAAAAASGSAAAKPAKSNGKTPVASATEKSAERPAHAEQRELARARRAAKPHADAIARAKRIWEQLRRGTVDTPKARRRELVDELFDLIRGRARELALRHDASRVLQTGVKYGTREQRAALAEELKGSYRALAESRFAKFLVGKLLARGDGAVRDAVVAEFFGGVRKMIRHPEAGWILDDVYRGAATQAQKARLLREWYGGEFAVFDARALAAPDGKEAEKALTADLGTILQREPGRRGPIMRALWELINALVQKRTTGFTMLHDALLQYALNSGGDEATELTALLVTDETGDLLKNLAFTASGARVVSLALARGAAKERKQILRAYKGVMALLTADAHGVQVLLTALAVVDDTVLTAKAAYGELYPALARNGPANGNSSTQTLAPDDDDNPVLRAALHPTARLPLLHPFARDPAALLTNHPAALAVHRETTAIRDGGASKKHPATRRAELARALAPQALACIARTAPRLLAHGVLGCGFVADVLLGARPSGETELAARNAALGAVVAVVRDGVPSDVDGSGGDAIGGDALVAQPPAGRLLKALALSGRFDAAAGRVVLTEPKLGFADRLWAEVGAVRVVRWAGGAASFVVVGLLESEDFEAKGALREALGRQRAWLEGQVAGNKGASLVLKLLDG